MLNYVIHRSDVWNYSTILMAFLVRRGYARKVISNFNCCNSPYTVCFTSFTLCAAIWLVYEDTKNIIFVKNVWVRVVENVEVLIFAFVSVASSIEQIVVGKEKGDDHVNSIRSIERLLNHEPSKERYIEYRPLFLIFYVPLVLLTAFQIFFVCNQSNYQRFTLIAIGQFYLLDCVLRFVSLISNVERNFAHLNEKLKDKFNGNKSVEVGCFLFMDTGGRYVYNSLHPNGLYVDEGMYMCGVVTVDYYRVTDFSILRSAHDFSNLHWSICKYVHAANNLYGLRLLACIICLFYELMFTPYLLSLNLINGVHPKTSSKVLTYACSLIFHLTELLLLTLSAESATKEAKQTSLIFAKYLSNDLQEEEFNEIGVILTYFEVHKVEFKIKNLFVLNRNLILRIFGAVTTYTIIFIQLQDVIKSN